MTPQDKQDFFETADEEYLEEVEARVKKEVNEAVKFAEESNYPDPSEIYKDVYVQEDYPFIED